MKNKTLCEKVIKHFNNYFQSALSFIKAGFLFAELPSAQKGRRNSASQMSTFSALYFLISTFLCQQVSYLQYKDKLINEK